MTKLNYKLLLSTLYLIQDISGRLEHASDNLIRIGHLIRIDSKDASAQFHSVNILNIDANKKIMQILIDAKIYDITLDEIQDMKIDEEKTLFNEFLHALIKKYNNL